MPTSGSKPTVSGGTFAVDGEPQRITQGPDGNVWFGVNGNSGLNDLARITPAGTITYYQLGSVNIGTLVTGPDGNLWATIDTGVAKIPTADPTTLTTFAIGGFANAQGIAVGPDGKVHAFKTDGTFTSVDVGGNPQGIAAGPGGQVLYTNPEGGANHAARLTLGGTLVKTPLPGTDPSFSVAFGADDAYWVGLFLTREMARITPDGELTKYGTFPAPYLPRVRSGRSRQHDLGVAPGPRQRRRHRTGHRARRRRRRRRRPDGHDQGQGRQGQGQERQGQAEAPVPAP